MKRDRVIPKLYLYPSSSPEGCILGIIIALQEKVTSKETNFFPRLDNSICTLFDLEINQKNSLYSFIIKFFTIWTSILNEGCCKPKDFWRYRDE